MKGSHREAGGGRATASPWKSALAKQFDAAIEMLENAIRACPEAEWSDESVPVSQRFWYVAYHTLFWLDYYLAPDEKGYAPPAPFGLEEMDPAGVHPDRVYTPADLLAFLGHDRRRCRARLAGLTEQAAAEHCGFERRELSVLGLLLYNLRHVQHHTGQLNLLLRQKTHAAAPRWVG